MDIRRHAPLGRARPRFASVSLRSRPHAYIGRSGRPLPEIYASDHADMRRGGRFRWLLSTTLAGAVGVLAILVVIAGAMDTQRGDTQRGKAGLLASLEERLRPPPLVPALPAPRAEEGLRWAMPKADKMLMPTGAVAMKSYIPDTVKQRRGNREYTMNRYYVRLAARLGALSKKQAKTVPAFNAYKLYSDVGTLDGGERPDGQNLAAPPRILELNGILANEDGQELDAERVLAFVVRAQAAEKEAGSAGGALLADRAQRLADSLAPQTTALHKAMPEQEDDLSDDAIGLDLPAVKVKRGDTLTHILARLTGEQTEQVQAMAAATRTVLANSALQPGYEIRAVMMPAATGPGGDLVRFSVFDQSGAHKVTVTRSGTGEYVPSSTPPDDERLTRKTLADRVQDGSLYASIYSVAVKQGLPPDLITQILRIHAYGTDFRQRVRIGDGIEMFFDIKDEERGIDGEIGDLLATFITAGGTTDKFYRFRTTDGTVDFYDAEGSTARKFLMRQPVRCQNARLTSGYGMRKHPLLHTMRMHSGIDWACPEGTPIMAAGNGIIETAGPKGEAGNYIRIRHANGYKTAYAHLAGFAAGLADGVRVRQGQTIGYVGSTGLSSGPHLHFEVSVKNLFDGNFTRVDPRTIPVPNDRRLTGKDLADFKRERARIDDLMRRPPVRTAHLPS